MATSPPRAKASNQVDHNLEGACDVPFQHVEVGYGVLQLSDGTLPSVLQARVLTRRYACVRPNASVSWSEISVPWVP
eukprot:1627106-Amphidinium_carterae.2